MKTVQYHVPAINCKHCVMTIKREVSGLEGVKTVEGDLPSKLVTVTLDAPATQQAIESLMQEIGYPVQR